MVIEIERNQKIWQNVALYLKSIKSSMNSRKWCAINTEHFLGVSVENGPLTEWWRVINQQMKKSATLIASYSSIITRIDERFLTAQTDNS